MKKIIKFIVPVSLLLVVVIPSFSLAQDTFLIAANHEIYDNTDDDYEIYDNTGGDSASIDNPLQADSIEELFLKILDVILIFAVPIIVFFIMYAGFLYVTARGDETKIKTAHGALTWAVVGGVIVLGAKLILEVIEGTISNF